MCNWSTTGCGRRISSSTVCSVRPSCGWAASMRRSCGLSAAKGRRDAHERAAEGGSDEAGAAGAAGAGNAAQPAHARRAGRWTRSEEHTSELQSLMRISYAVFCLKKKTSKEHNATEKATQ